jgi:hypothetical protein
MKGLGFVKSGNRWSRTCEKAIQVINLQGSNWGKQYYVNLGLYFINVGSIEIPKENQCHIRCRLSALVPDKVAHDYLLDFEQNIDEDVGANGLAEMIERYGVPWLSQCSSEKGAKSYFSEKNHKGIVLTKVARDYLGID